MSEEVLCGTNFYTLDVDEAKVGELNEYIKDISDVDVTPLTVEETYLILSGDKGYENSRAFEMIKCSDNTGEYEVALWSILNDFFIDAVFCCGTCETSRDSDGWSDTYSY